MGVIDELKEVADLAKKLGAIDLYRRIASLEGEVIDLTRHKRYLEERVAELERALKFKDDLRFREGFYWIEGDRTPFCPGCWDSKRDAIRLARAPHNATELLCPVCKHAYRNRHGI